MPEGPIGLTEPVGRGRPLPGPKGPEWPECDEFGPDWREECGEWLEERMEGLFDAWETELVRALDLLLVLLLLLVGKEEEEEVAVLLLESAAVFDEAANAEEVVEEVGVVDVVETPLPVTTRDVLTELTLAVPLITVPGAVPFIEAPVGTVPTGAVPLPPEGIVIFPAPVPFPPAVPEPRLSPVAATPPSAPYAAAISTV